MELPDVLVHRPGRAHRRHLLDEPAPGTPLRSGLPRHAQRARSHRPRRHARGDGLRAPDLHTGVGGRPGEPGRPRHRPDRLRRRVPRVGLPRGRVPLRRSGCPALRGDLVTMTRLPTTRVTTTVQTSHTAAARRPTQPELPSLPALVPGNVTHRRRGKVRHSFRYGVYQWLVDLDALPEQPWYLRPFAGFSAADHVGDPDRPIRRTSSASWTATASGSVSRAGLSCWRTPGSWAMCSTRYRSSGASTGPARWSASSPRSTTPTASGTPTSCAPTRPGSPPRKRRSTSPPSMT